MDDIDRVNLILSGHCAECLCAPGEEHLHGCSKESAESIMLHNMGKEIGKEIDKEILEALHQASQSSSTLVAKGRLA